MGKGVVNPMVPIGTLRFAQAFRTTLTRREGTIESTAGPDPDGNILVGFGDGPVRKVRAGLMVEWLQ